MKSESRRGECRTFGAGNRKPPLILPADVLHAGLEMCVISLFVGWASILIRELTRVVWIYRDVLFGCCDPLCFGLRGVICQHIKCGGWPVWVLLSFRLFQGSGSDVDRVVQAICDVSEDVGLSLQLRGTRYASKALTATYIRPSLQPLKSMELINTISSILSTQQSTHLFTPSPSNQPSTCLLPARKSVPVTALRV